MSYADMIQQRLHSLSPAQQAEVFDFVEFLASRRATSPGAAEGTSAAVASPARVPMWLDEAAHVPPFTPLSREEANARD